MPAGPSGPAHRQRSTPSIRASATRREQITSGPKADRGPVVPLGQFTFVPRLPARIAKLSATVGQSISADALTLAIGSPTISGQLNPSEAIVVRPGMPVTITEPGSGAPFPAGSPQCRT